MAAAAILDFIELEIAPLVSAVPVNPTLEPDMEWIGRPVAEKWPFEIFPQGGGRHLGFFEPEIAPLDRRPRKPLPRTKHGVDRTTGCGDMPI